MPGQRAKVKITESDSNHLIEWFKINKMQANPDKFQVLAVGKKTYEKRPTINIQNFELTFEDSVKLDQNRDCQRKGYYRLHNYTENCL
jgi:hypothetical protein